MPTSRVQLVRLGVPNRNGDTSEAHHREDRIRLGVSIPRKKSRPCSLKPFKGATTFPFADLLDIMEFALDNTVLRDFDGNLWRQAMGIPMGDPHSLGMTIATCAWMEHEWLESLDEATKRLFKIKRYMDDLLIFSAENSTWDRDGFEKSIGEECYFPPLTLEDGSEGTFLETSFKITASNCIRHWLKNTNELVRSPRYGATRISRAIRRSFKRS